MKSYFVLLGAVSAAQISSTELKFVEYIAQFGKSYGTIEEYQFRFAQFTRNHEVVIKHNAILNKSFSLGYNKMSDWTQDEYKNLLNFKTMPESEYNFQEAAEKTEVSPVDWVAAGAVNSVKDQGQCGSCWAFSAVGTLESAHQIASGTLYNFSEQQVVDCSLANLGCNGGWQYKAYNYYKTSFAMTTSEYPYTARDGSCKYNSADTTGKGATGYVTVAANDSDSMKIALAGRPLAVSIEADQTLFQNYESGIFDSELCGTTLDHAVIVVGWGVTDSVEYWTIRNSWGATWGEKGYIRMAITDGSGICGVQIQPLYPTV